MICHLWFVESFFPSSALTILLKRRIHYKDHHLLFRNCFVLKRCFCMCVCVCVLCSLTSNCKDSEPFGPFSLTEMTAHDSSYQSTRIYCPVSSINSLLHLYVLPTIQKRYLQQNLHVTCQRSWPIAREYICHKYLSSLNVDHYRESLKQEIQIRSN